jgi:hypothetical protein
MFTLIMRLSLFLAALLVPVAAQAHGIEGGVSPELGRIVARCSHSRAGSPEVVLFKQWHADASVDTHARSKAAGLPQAANQTAIFRQLDRWVRRGSLRTIVAEGCQGELDRASPVKFNGWSVRELEAESGRPGFDAIVASVPEKLEARYGTRLRVVCGDDPSLIREHQLALSDLRGAYGFLTRLDQYRDDPAKTRLYLGGVIEAYHLAPDTTAAQARERLKKALREGMERMHQALDRRNEAVISAIRRAGSGPIGVVYGGAHAPGLLEKLDRQGFRCSVIEPAGYRNDEAKLMEELEAAIRKL